MKIVGRYEKIKPLNVLYVVLGLLCVAAPVRTYQLLSIIEPDTGFYKAVDWSVYLMYALAFLAVIVPYAVVMLGKNIPASRSTEGKSKLLGASSVIFAVGIMIDVVSSFSVFLTSLNSADIVNASNKFPLMLEGLFGVLAAIYMLIFGISYIDGRTAYSKLKFLALTPLFWSVARIVLRFMRKIAYVNISDLMLELFSIAFMMLFLLAFARISSGLSANKAMRSLFASGFVCIFLCTVTNLPRLILLITGNGAFLPEGYPFSFCDFAFAFFAFAYIVKALRSASLNDGGELAENEKTASE